MAFQVRTERRPVTSDSGETIFLIEAIATGARVEICPALGFNCFRWRTPWDGRLVELLHADPDFLDNGRPTRSGIPVLFPFPNRIRSGHFTWDGKEYQLALNDSTKKYAIHGFACRKPWRVVEQGGDEHSGWIAGEFRGSTDAPESLPFWPADYRIRITYRLTTTTLRIEAAIDNPDRVSLPFGLGYHPYFRVPLLAGAGAEETHVQAKAHEYWELEDNLPTGVRLAVDPARNLTCPRRFHELYLDDDLTGLDSAVLPESGLCYRGMVAQAGSTLQMFTSPDFRELVAFTPPHRQAVCLEPYTCVTDAINLQQRGLDAGLQVLQPGQRWLGTVEMKMVTA